MTDGIVLDVDNTRSDGMSGWVTMTDTTNGNTTRVHWNVYADDFRTQGAAAQHARKELIQSRM